jgi:hypothetical protein
LDLCQSPEYLIRCSLGAFRSSNLFLQGCETAFGTFNLILVANNCVIGGSNSSLCTGLFVAVRNVFDHTFAMHKAAALIAVHLASIAHGRFFSTVFLITVNASFAFSTVRAHVAVAFAAFRKVVVCSVDFSVAADITIFYVVPRVHFVWQHGSSFQSS